MAETTNIGLHQWAAEDPVLRTDFNADFAKIDRAVGAIPLIKLKEVVTTQDAQQLDVDVSDIDFDLYDEVIVYAELVNTKDDSNVSPYCAILINGDTTSNIYGTSGSASMSSSYNFDHTYLLYPGAISANGYYTCDPLKLRFKRKGNFLFCRCEYGYVRHNGPQYYFKEDAGVYKMASAETAIAHINITVSNPNNNYLKAGCKFRILGVQK